MPLNNLSLSFPDSERNGSDSNNQVNTFKIQNVNQTKETNKTHKIKTYFLYYIKLHKYSKSVLNWEPFSFPTGSANENQSLLPFPYTGQCHQGNKTRALVASGLLLRDLYELILIHRVSG